MKKIFLCLFFFGCFHSAVFADSDELETIGILSGQSLYISYTAIGLVFDNFNTGAYDSDFSMRLCKAIAASCKKSKASIQRLIDKGGLNSGDEDQAKEIITVYESLVSESNALASVIENNSAYTAQQFQTYRLRAWSKIESLLNLNE
jgi:hypothetical protein